MWRELVQWLDDVPMMDYVAIAAAIVLVSAWIAKQSRRPMTHDERVAMRREHVRQIVNRDIARRERMRLSEMNRVYENDPFRWS